MLIDNRDTNKTYKNATDQIAPGHKLCFPDGTNYILA